MQGELLLAMADEVSPRTVVAYCEVTINSSKCSAEGNAGSVSKSKLLAVQ